MLLLCKHIWQASESSLSAIETDQLNIIIVVRYSVQSTAVLIETSLKSLAAPCWDTAGHKQRSRVSIVHMEEGLTIYASSDTLASILTG